jgi:transposase
MGGLCRSRLKEPLMAIFVGLDVHRAQITYDALDTDTGEVRTGRIRPANRGTVRAFLTRLVGRRRSSWSRR